MINYSLNNSSYSKINQKKRRLSPKIFKFLYYLVPTLFSISIILTLFFLPSVTKLNAYSKPKESAILTINSNKLYQQSLKSDNGINNSLEKNTVPNKHLKYRLQHASFTDNQLKVIDQMKYSWNAYKKYAWGADHLKPVSRQYHNWFGVGLTIIDSIDTLVLMGLDEEIKDILEWTENSLNFDKDVEVNCFETTIRVLGGLLSAYHLTDHEIFKKKALDIGERLYFCYKSPLSKVPFSDVNLKSKASKSPNWLIESSTSEISTIQIEFRDLSRIVGNSKFEDITFETSSLLHNLVKKTNDPLVRMYVNPNTEEFKPSRITLGARADSYYEYLIKQYIQTGIEWLQEDYFDAIFAIKNRLLKTTKGNYKLTFTAEITENGAISPKQDHLVCFLPGALALGYYKFTKKYENKTNIPKYNDIPLDVIYKEHLEIAESLARTCYFTHNTTETGLAPEITYFEMEESNTELFIHTNDRHSLLRPEFIESLFYLYHITGKNIYREQGEKILDSFINYCRVETGGFTTINDVTNKLDVKPRDFQESFWTGETLKYFFLLFSDDKNIIEKILNDYVINTEAHLMKIYVSP